MKILYAVQATGNGHISRAMELYPYLKKFGEIDIFLSGANSHLPANLPVKFRSKGLSLFYNCNGGLDYFQLIKKIQPITLRREIRELPVEDYDLIINDFEHITASACALKKVPSIQFGHQASFQSQKTPRPSRKSFSGEWLLKNYARADAYVGLHFDRYEDYIFPPIIKKSILDAEPADLDYYTVYLPSYCEDQLLQIFGSQRDFKFEIFSFQTRYPSRVGNILFLPLSKERFNISLVNCSGIITGGGFETPAEALHLGKRLMVIPIRGQYEQQCNAASLEKLGIKKLDRIGIDFKKDLELWVNHPKVVKMNYAGSLEESVAYLMSVNERLNLKLVEEFR